MLIQVVYFEGCPNWQITHRRLLTALEATGHAGVTVDLVAVGSPEAAAAAGFAGSPTVLVDGRDLFPDAAPVTELACRVYRSPQGLSGSPSPEVLVAALNDLPTAV
ncbi:thioredoxin family protein [Kineosporia sp. NBRC 101731]|uniref:DF family (seleno)protein n=1 Tax=Kineosporia sp. NBRC 101731 TaxID=3032199 RepID=UPI002557121B|nr:thioredoxin family protein [Kineosporia sp. NBRC 101731]